MGRDRDGHGHGHDDGHADSVDANEADVAADGYGGTSRPHQAATAAARCVYKKIVDLLLQQNEGADDGTTADGGRDAAAAVEGGVFESSSGAPKSVACEVDVHNDDNVYDDDVCDDGVYDDDDVCDEDEDDGNGDDLTTTARDVALSQQVSAAEWTARDHHPSTAFSDRPTVAGPARDSTAVAIPARVRTTAATVRLRVGDAQQVTVKKPAFIDKLLRRNKRAAVEIKTDAKRSTGFRKSEKKTKKIIKNKKM